jgi:spermidine synthase
MKFTGRGVPSLFYPLIILSGMGTGICLYIWLRQYTLFFGIHTLSVITIIITILAGIAIGSMVLGKLSDKISGLLLFLFTIEMLKGIYILLHPFLFSKLTWLFDLINKETYPGTFGVEILRFLLSFIFLLIPTMLIGGFMPILSRFLVQQIRRPGIIISGVIALLTFGIFLGVILSVFIFIQQFGIPITLILAGIIFILNAVLIFVLKITGLLKTPLPYKPSMARRIRQTTIRFRKRKNVLGTSAKLTQATLHVHFFHGIMIMSLLIICFRIFIGFVCIKPTDFHIVIILVALIGLLLGSVLYRIVAEKPANSFLLMASLKILTGLFTLIVFIVLVFLTPDLIRNITGVIHGIKSWAYQIFLFSFLLLIPSINTGLTLPLSGKIYCKRIQITGISIGRLGTIFILGTISGLILTGIILIPLVGLYHTFFLMIFVTLLSGIYLLFRDSRLKRGFRLVYTLLALSVYALLLIFILRTDLLRKKSFLSTRASVIEMHEGISGRVEVLKMNDGNRAITIEGTQYYETGTDGMKIQQLPALLPNMLNKNIQSALVIGFGMGITASVLDEIGMQKIHISEVFPEIVTRTSYVFSDLNNDILTGSNVEITIEDPRIYLIRSEFKFDLVTSGSSYSRLLPNLYTSDFYKICFNKLSDSGILCQILPTDQITISDFRSLIKSCVDVFPQVYLWYLNSERLLMLASKTKLTIDYGNLSGRFLQLNGNRRFDIMGIPTIESLLTHLLLDDTGLRMYVTGAQENSDNKPSIEYSRDTCNVNDPELLKQLMEYSVMQP